MRAPCAVYSASGIVLPLAGARLHDHLVTVLGQLAHAGRRERHPVLVGLDLRRNSDLHSLSHRSLIAVTQFSGPQREPELDPVARARQVAARELLHPPDAVAQRMAVAVELARRPLPLAVLLDERLERADQLVAVLAGRVLERAEHAVAVEPQRLVVLQRQQQLERAQVAVGGDLRARGRWPAPPPRARSAPRGRSAAARPTGAGARRRGAQAPVLGRSASRARPASATGSRPSRASTTAQSSRSRGATSAPTPASARKRSRSASASAAGRRRLAANTSTAACGADAEGAQAHRQLGLRQPAGERLGQHVAGQAPLGVAHRALAHQLERDHGHGLLQDQPLEVAEPAGVARGHQPGLRARRARAWPRAARASGRRSRDGRARTRRGLADPAPAAAPRRRTSSRTRVERLLGERGAGTPRTAMRLAARPRAPPPRRRWPPPARAPPRRARAPRAPAARAACGSRCRAAAPRTARSRAA